MGDKLRFEKLTHTKYKVARVDSTGNLVSEMEVTDKPYRLKDAGKVLCIPWVELKKMLTAFQQTGKAEIDLDPQPEKQPAVFLVRGLKQEAKSGVTFSDIFAALTFDSGQEDPVVEWDGTEEYCILDLDFHKGDKPDESSLRQCADTVRPLPLAWWYSKSGGLHLLYCAGVGLQGCEFAAIASVKIAARLSAARIEIKCSTRQPPGEIIRVGGHNPSASETGGMGGRTVDQQPDHSDWLTDHGYEVGKRYPHTLCPVNPSQRAEGNADPVVVSTDYIMCYICQADGIKRGSKTPGYFPLAVLAGTVQESMFRKCVENFTHWQHAKHIICQVVQQENLAELVYRAALKQRHGDDPRIPLVWTAGPKTGLIRCDGYWMGDSGRVKTYDDRSAVLAGLPVAKYREGDELRTSAAIVEELASTDDLTPYGYPALIRVWGVRLTEMQDQPADKIFTVLQRNGKPEFLSTSRRMPEEEAWKTIECLYPGVNRKAVELLIAAKGCIEYRAGLPPMVFLTGPTGAGKTQSIHLAASICGDQVTTVTFATDQERLRQQVLYAKERGSYAFFDEYLKSARQRHVEPDQAMEFVLNLTPDSSSHKLYVGPVCLGEMPVCVFADTMLPAEVVAHSQIARRMHHVPLRDSKQWNRFAKDLRTEGDEYVKAADSLLSWIMDRWFPPPGPTDFADVAKALGFFLFNSDEAAQYKERLIRTFFELVCAAPDAEVKVSKSLPDPRGYKLIDPQGTGELAETWLALADGNKPTSQALCEKDLKSVLGLSEFVECQLHGIKGGRVLVRFANERRDKINENLKCG